MGRCYKSMAVIFMLLIFLGVLSLQAYWMEDGVPICTAQNPQEEPHIISDSAGGAIIAWHDKRNGNDNVDIYAGRIDSSGNVLWGDTAICAADSNQWSPRLVSDGSGGAIITWQDMRATGTPGESDIYAQRVDASGNILWENNGTPVCTVSPGGQYEPRPTSDGAGGAIIAWRDTRCVNNCIYAQRIDANGDTLWTKDGIPVDTYPGAKNHPESVSGIHGGAVIAWEDQRHGNWDIFSGKVDTSGNVLWSTMSAPVCTAMGDQLEPQLISDGTGGAIIVWKDSRNGDWDIYIQRIDENGNPLWSVDGEVICPKLGRQEHPRITTDCDGGAIITWWEEGGIYAQRVDGNGLSLWDDTCNVVASGSRGEPRITSDGNGGAIITWSERRTDANIYAQKIDPSGELQWRVDGVPICKADGDQVWPELTSNGSEGAIITWSDDREPDNGYDIYAQHVDCSWPTKPQNLTGTVLVVGDTVSVGLKLTWNQNIEPNIMEYAVYRGLSENFVPTLENLICNPEKSDTVCYDMEWRWMPHNFYKASAIDSSGCESWYALLTYDSICCTNPICGDDVPEVHVSNHLAQNFPNPFNPFTRIVFAIKEPAGVTLRIYDVSGRLIRTLIEERREAGRYNEIWDGTDENGKAVDSGVYFYCIVAGEFKEAKKLVLLR